MASRRSFALAAGLLLAGSAAAVVAPPVLALRSRVQQARRQVGRAAAYEQLGNDGGAVLIVGDSTARGTGAATPEQSLAGRIGAALPGTRIVNRARDGATFADVAEQLRQAPALPYRFVLVVAGANDVLQLAAPAAVALDAARALQLARRRAPDVVLMALPNVSHAPLLPWPLDRLMGLRAQLIQGQLQRIAYEQEVPLVNLYFEGEADPFRREPERYLAADLLHPSSEGYALWFRALRATVPGLLRG